MRVSIIVVPYDSGRRGARMGAGPQRILMSGFSDRLRSAGHDVVEHVVEAPDDSWAGEVRSAFDLAAEVARLVRDARESSSFALILSGNCAPAALGAVAALGGHAGVLWFDAHGDLNSPETTQSGFFDGMALSVVLGHCWTRMAESVPGFAPVPEEAVALIGARDLDPLEELRLAQSRIAQISGTGLRGAMGSFLQGHASPARPAYVHVDLDVLDIEVARVNEYAAAGGVRMADLEWALEAIATATPVRVASITAYDPTFDQAGAVPKLATRIAMTLLKHARPDPAS